MRTAPEWRLESQRESEEVRTERGLTDDMSNNEELVETVAHSANAEDENTKKSGDHLCRRARSARALKRFEEGGRKLTARPV